MWSDKARLAAADKNRIKSKLLLQGRINEYNQHPKRCLRCGKNLLYKQRHNTYCSLSCSISAGNMGRARNVKKGDCSRKKKPAGICRFCGNGATGKVSCRKCIRKGNQQKRRQEIQVAGRLITGKKDKWFLIETREHRCEKCLCSEWLGQPIPLDIHHCDGNSDNNNLENLILICPNCHRCTKNHGSKNRVGRSKRKEYRKIRYELGLSY